MKKTDKKIEKTLREALTAVCEEAMADMPGFSWITHRVRYERFPASLKIICVFETDEALSNAYNSDGIAQLRQRIARALAQVGVKLANPRQQILFDSEQACDRVHHGEWSLRLAKLYD